MEENVRDRTVVFAFSSTVLPDSEDVGMIYNGVLLSRRKILDGEILHAQRETHEMESNSYAS